MRNLLFLLLLLQIDLTAQSTLVERLGYPADKKLLIIHADDLGVAHSENAASFEAMTEGSVNSASIMAPTPWVAEVADWARKHPDADLGIHLTLTNEWKHYRWSPIAPKSEVPGLINELGFLYPDCGSVYANASPEEVEIELRAQIEQILKFDISPTHLDSHMGCLFYNPDYFEIYLRLGREYKLPVLLPYNEEMIKSDHPMGRHITKDDLIIDYLESANPPNYNNGFEEYYTGVLENLKSGVTVLLIHCAYDNHEMQGIAVDHPEWGSAWRQADLDFFKSDKSKMLLEKHDIELITWRELGKKWNASMR